MKKYIGQILAFVAVCYLWFVAFPKWFNYSFPSGGWDWLSFVGTVGSVFFALYGIKEQLNANHVQMLEQQRLSIIPCLDVDAYTKFSSQEKNASFRKFKEEKNRIVNDGYTIVRSEERQTPQNFNPKVNINVRNIGFSTAMQVEVYLYRLDEVEGLTSLKEISSQPIDDFYSKVKYSNYEYYECTKDDAKPIEHDWLISPQYNLSNSDSSEFNLVFDLTEIKLKYHSILKFVFSDMYDNEYYQLMYLFFDNIQIAVYPISRVKKC